MFRETGAVSHALSGVTLHSALLRDQNHIGWRPGQGAPHPYRGCQPVAQMFNRPVSVRIVVLSVNSSEALNRRGAKNAENLRGTLSPRSSRLCGLSKRRVWLRLARAAPYRRMLQSSRNPQPKICAIFPLTWCAYYTKYGSCNTYTSYLAEYGTYIPISQSGAHGGLCGLRV